MALFLALYLGLALAAFSGRPLTVTPLYGVRTFLPPGITRWPAAVWLASSAYCTAPRPRRGKAGAAKSEIWCRHFKSLRRRRGLEWRKLAARRPSLLITKVRPMTHPTRTGGQILVDALKIHGVDTAFGVPGESYLDVLDALHDSDIRFVINRQEGGAAFMADAYGKMTGQPGICFVTRGPGATNASHRRAHGVPGFDADDPLHRPGRQRLRRPRGVPGNRLPPHVRPDGQVGGADRPRRPHPRIHRARLPGRHQRPSRPGGAGAAGGHADLDGRRGRHAPLPAGAGVAVGRADGAAARDAGRRRAAAAAAGRRRLERAGLRRPAALRRSRTTCRWRAPSASRICSTTRTRTMSATSASASIRSWPRACATPT